MIQKWKIKNTNGNFKVLLYVRILKVLHSNWNNFSHRIILIVIVVATVSVFCYFPFYSLPHTVSCCSDGCSIGDSSCKYGKSGISRGCYSSTGECGRTHRVESLLRSWKRAHGKWGSKSSRKNGVLIRIWWRLAARTFQFSRVFHFPFSIIYHLV